MYKGKKNYDCTDLIIDDKSLGYINVRHSPFLTIHVDDTLMASFLTRDENISK